MADRKVKIDIQTTANTKGVTDANKGLGDLGKSAHQASGMVGKMSSAMGQAGSATSKLSSALGAFGQIARGLQGGITGLATILIGLAVNAVVKFMQATKEAEKAIQDFNAAMAKSRTEAANRRFEQEIRSRHQLRDAILEEANALQRLNQAYAAVDNAQKASDLADIDLAEQTALAGIGTGPAADIKRAQIQAKYASQRRDTTRHYDTLELDRQTQAASAKITTTEALRDSHRADIAQNTAAIDKLNTRLQELYSARRAVSGGIAPEKIDFLKMDHWFNPGTKVDKEAQSAMLEEIAEQAKGIKEQLATRKQLIAEGNKKLEETDNELWALRAERSAAQIKSAAHHRTQPRLDTLADQAAETAIERQRNQQRLQELRRRATTARDLLGTRAATLRAESDAYDPIRADYPRQRDYNAARDQDRKLENQARGAEKMHASAKQLEDYLQRLDPERLSQSFGNIVNKLQRLENAITDINNRSKNQR